MMHSPRKLYLKLILSVSPLAKPVNPGLMELLLDILTC